MPSSIPGFPRHTQSLGAPRRKAGALPALDPDIIAVQEASDSRRHGNVPERLARELGFHIVFAPATDHVFGIWPIDTVVVSIMGFK